MNLMCKLFGHKMVLDTPDPDGHSTCTRCGFQKRSNKWPYVPGGEK